MRIPPGAQLVFQQVLTTPPLGGYSSTANSDPKFNDWLGVGDDIKLFVVVDRSTADGSKLIVAIQDSSDEELYWRTTSTPLPLVSISSSDVTILTASETEVDRGAGLAFRRLAVQLGNDATGPISARVRIWATGRSNYRRFHRLLFREHLQGTDTVYAPLAACASLVGVDKVGISFFAEEFSLEAQLMILLGESPDGRNWSDLPAGPFLLPQTAYGGTYLPDTFPWSGFLRLGLQLVGATDFATVRLWVTGRDVRLK